TGYRISFPFFPEGLLDAPDNRIPLFRRVVAPDLDGLYFIGLVQPLGAIMPLAEAQSEWVADILEGASARPDRERMWKVIKRDDEKVRGRYVRSPRHTIQVDFYPYMRVIERERKRGRRRARGRGPSRT